MAAPTSWVHFVNAQGDFELPNYIFRTLMDLMKTTLDIGTLLSNDPAKLRAFKEQTKAIFKKRWMDVAQALESFDIIVACGCSPQDFCRACGGSRFRLNTALSPDKMREISLIVGTSTDPGIAKKLQDGLSRALAEVQP